MLHPVRAMAIGIVVMMALIIFTKMHAFPSLIISAILIAVLAMPFGSVDSLTACVKTVTTGFGNTMGSIGVVIGFGWMSAIAKKRRRSSGRKWMRSARPSPKRRKIMRGFCATSKQRSTALGRRSNACKIESAAQRTGLNSSGST